jgi:lauroyl/myristoyl acyltransferase
MGGVLDGCMMDRDRDRRIYVDFFGFYTAYLPTTSYTYFVLVRVIKS